VTSCRVGTGPWSKLSSVCVTACQSVLLTGSVIVWLRHWLSVPVPVPVPVHVHVPVPVPIPAPRII
jgi:hypothetical protein